MIRKTLTWPAQTNGSRHDPRRFSCSVCNGLCIPAIETPVENNHIVPIKDMVLIPVVEQQILNRRNVVALTGRVYHGDKHQILNRCHVVALTGCVYHGNQNAHYCAHRQARV